MNRALPIALTLLLASCARPSACPTIDPERLADALRSEWELRSELAEEGEEGEEEFDEEYVEGDAGDEVAAEEPAVEAPARLQVPVTDAQPSKGPADALVTIVEFSDFQCPFCARVNTTLASVLERYRGEVRIVFRNEPLPFHDAARPAAEAAMEAFAQGGNAKFWAMHDLLFANQSALAAADLERYARQVGLNLPRFRRAMREHTHAARIDEDAALASQVGARGTPNFFINGVQLVGAQPLEAFNALVDEELASARRLLDAGVARSAIYERALEGALERPSTPTPSAGAPTPGRPDPSATYQVPVLSSAPQRGPSDALVTIVMFSDFQCPFCARVEPTLHELRTQYGADLRIVWMNNPLPFHPWAMPSAEAAMEVFVQRGPEAFWAFHDALFEHQTELGEALITSLAEAQQVDRGRYRRALENHTHLAAITEQQGVARQFGASGTPAFFINGRSLSGARPLEQFTVLIDEELAKARELVANGVPRAEVYARTIADGLERVVPAPAAAPSHDVDDDRIYAIGLPARPRFVGPANARVTLQVFSDFQCPFCSRLRPTLAEVRAQYGDRVRIVFRDYPLPFHTDAMLAAEAAREVFAQGGNDAFWRFHDMLFENQRALDREHLDAYAASLGGIDMARFAQALDSHRHRAAVQADMDAIQAAGIEQFGTPTTFVNGKMIPGAVPYATFAAAIDDALSTAHAGRGER